MQLHRTNADPLFVAIARLDYIAEFDDDLTPDDLAADTDHEDTDR